MSNSTLSNEHREGSVANVGVLAADRGVESLRLWWTVWRWPAALLVGFVLWLALVTIAGATAPPACAVEATRAPVELAVEAR